MVAVSPLPTRLVDQSWSDRVPTPAHDSLTAAMRRQLLDNNPFSYMSVTRSRQDLPPEIDATDFQLLLAGKASLNTLLDAGAFGPCTGDCYHVYRLTSPDHSQTGIVGGVSVEDLSNGGVKMHESIHPERAVHLSNHFEVVGVQSSPIAVAHPPSAEISEIIDLVTEMDLPNVTVAGYDGLTQQVWPIDDPQLIQRVTNAMAGLDLYLIDGHHRAEAAIQYHNRTGDPGSDWMLSAWFSTTEMRNYAHHRTLAPVATGDDLIERLSRLTEVRVLRGSHPLDQVKDSELMVHVAGRWYGITQEVSESDRPELGGLDQTRLEHLLNSLFPEYSGAAGIRYRPGIVPITTLAGETDLSGASLFLMREVTMGQLLAVADAGLTMPPKSTYFSPKVRSGVFLRPCSQDFEP